MFSRGVVRKGIVETQLAMSWKPWRLWMMMDTQRFITLMYFSISLKFSINQIFLKEK